MVHASAACKCLCLRQLLMNGLEPIKLCSSDGDFEKYGTTTTRGGYQRWMLLLFQNDRFAPLEGVRWFFFPSLPLCLVFNFKDRKCPEMGCSTTGWMGNPTPPTLDHTSGDQVLADSLIESDNDADRIVSDCIFSKRSGETRLPLKTR